jgi:hypothetical protein
MILSPTFRRPKFEIFSAAKASPALLTFKSQNGDLKSIFKFWEENLQDQTGPSQQPQPPTAPALPRECTFSQ